MRRLVCLLALLGIGFSSESFAGILNWHYLESEHYVLYYHDGWEGKAKTVLSELELARAYTAKATGVETPKIPVVLEDLGIEANGFVSKFPFQMRLFPKTAATESDFSKDPNSLRLLITHEQTHVAQTSNLRGLGRQARDLLGNNYNIQWDVMNWMLEGYAVNVESTLGPPTGRLYHGYHDAAVLAKAYYNHFPSFMDMNNTTLLQFPPGFWYHYGSVFWQFIAQKYGPDSINRFFEELGRYPSLSSVFFIQKEFPDYYGVDTAFKAVYHKSIVDVYEEWKVEMLTESQEWRTGGTRKTWEGWIKPTMTSDGTSVYYVSGILYRTEPYSQTMLFGLYRLTPTTGETTLVTYLPHFSVGTLQYMNGNLYIGGMETRFGFDNISSNGFGKYTHLRKINPSTGESSIVLSNVGDAFYVAQNGTVYYAIEKQKSFGSELWKYDGTSRIKMADTPEVIGEIFSDADPGSLWVVSKSESQAWKITRVTLATGEVTPIVNSAWAETTAKRVGNSILFTSTLEGKYGVYRYDLTRKKIENLSTASFAKEAEIVGNTLVFTGITDTGEDLFVSTVNAIPVVWEPEVNTVYTPPPPVSYTSGTAWERNFTQEPLPYVRFFSQYDSTTVRGLREISWNKFSLLGADVLGMYTYQMDFIPSKGPSVTLITKEFLPAIFSVSKVLSDAATTVSVTIPLFRSEEFGFRNVSVGAVVNINGDATDYGPELSTTYAFSPFTQAMASAQYRTVSTQLQTTYQVVQSLPLFSQLTLTYFDWRATNGTPLFVGLDSYWSMTAQFSAQLAKLNWGLWSPNIYFEGLFARITGTADAVGAVSGGITYRTETRPYYTYEMVFEGYLANGAVRVRPTFGIDSLGAPIYTLGGMLIFN